jgi:hypothetical protein
MLPKARQRLGDVFHQLSTESLCSAYALIQGWVRAPFHSTTWLVVPLRFGQRSLLGTSPDHPTVGRLTTSDSHRARDCQQASISGETPGSSRSDPAGMMISRPLRVACGSGHPQFRQNEVEKLRAVGRSKRATLSSPDNQRNAGGKTYAFAEHALPVAPRHREQWHLINLMNGRSTSNSTNPQRHPPRTDISYLLGSVSKILSARPPN